MSSRESFVARFGEDQARVMEQAAEDHQNEVHSRKGSDPFKWAVCICIGYECFVVEAYRKQHGFTAPREDIEKWIRTEADLGSHDGDVDYLGFLAGAYNKYLSKEETTT